MTKPLHLVLDKTHVRAGERICVAVSGGADSVALLFAILEANTPSPQNREPLGIVLSAAHVHHGLRGTEADRDASFVRSLCERLQVPLIVFNVDTPARQAEYAEGVEEAARELRYGALRGLAVDAVATAHTLDDQAETVVMKLLRGAWTEGLGSIAPIVENKGQPRVIRPLLEMRREHVEAFLRERGEAWCEDSSNRDISLTRNRIRHELMPLLRTFNPGIDGLLANLSALARADEAHWAAELRRILPLLVLPGKPVRGGGRAVGVDAGEAGCGVELERLRMLDGATRGRVIRAMARNLGFRLTFEETAKLLALCGLGNYPGITGRTGSRLELRGGLRAERTARELRLWRG